MNQQHEKAYQAYLFDLDGTLVDSEPLKGQALAEACSQYGERPDSGIYRSVMGGSWSVVTDHFFAQAKIRPDINQFNQYFRASYEQLLREQARLTPGVKSYLGQLKQRGAKLAVVSSAATWMVELLLEQLELSDMFDLVITQEHVTRHKPDPAAYLLALEQLGLHSQDALVFEDSTAGLQAASAAGCDVIAVRHGYNGENDLDQALVVISSFDDVTT